MSANAATMTSAAINQTLLTDFATSSATWTVYLPASTAIRTFNLAMTVAFSAGYLSAAVTIVTRMLAVPVAMFARLGIASISELKIEIALVISSVNMPEIELVNADGIVVRRTSFFSAQTFAGQSASLRGTNRSGTEKPKSACHRHQVFW